MVMEEAKYKLGDVLYFIDGFSATDGISKGKVVGVQLRNYNFDNGSKVQYQYKLDESIDWLGETSVSISPTEIIENLKAEALAHYNAKLISIGKLEFRKGK
jgi:hypothetical protein